MLPPHLFDLTISRPLPPPIRNQTIEWAQYLGALADYKRIRKGEALALCYCPRCGSNRYGIAGATTDFEKRIPSCRYCGDNPQDQMEVEDLFDGNHSP